MRIEESVGDYQKKKIERGKGKGPRLGNWGQFIRRLKKI